MPSPDSTETTGVSAKYEHAPQSGDLRVAFGSVDGTVSASVTIQPFIIAIKEHGIGCHGDFCDRACSDADVD